MHSDRSTESADAIAASLRTTGYHRLVLWCSDREAGRMHPTSISVLLEVGVRESRLSFLFFGRLLVVACALMAGMSSIASGQQQIDIAFGLNAVTAPSAKEANGDHFPQSLTGGAYPSFSADVVFYKNLGVQGE